MNRGARRAACVAGLLVSCSRGEPPVSERASRPSPPPDCAAVVSNAQLRAASRIDNSSFAPAPGQPQRRLYFGVLGDSSRRRHLYEFEVDSQVRRVDGDSSAAAIRNSRALVQFVVDSAGAVDTSTVKVIAARERILTREAAVAAVREWRYRPARVDGCVVSQLLQVELP